jgi:pimeloyl-ACP methyl ester carboxylesterase
VTPNSQKIDAGGHALRVVRVGSGPPVFLCLHGLVDTLEIWDRVSPGLEARGGVVRYDQRAHGESEAPAGPYGREDLAAVYGERSRRQVSGDAQGIAHVTRMLKSLHTDPLTPKLAAVHCPTLLIVGEDDPMGPRASEIIASALPDATLRVLPGRGHWTHVEAAEDVLAALDPWLVRVADRAD